MAKISEKTLAHDIYAHIGGTGNVSNVINCMTRVSLKMNCFKLS